ncbi:MAG: DUF4058 family protein [Chloroflexota bacterium]
MAYVFPGMDPWLEDEFIWKDVHNTLSVAIRHKLSPQLPPNYYIGIEKHTYIEILPNISSRYPDVAILNVDSINRQSQTNQPQKSTQQSVLEPSIIAPVEVDLPLEGEFEYSYLKIQKLPNREVVTVIEILSHANKKVGDNRDQYLTKRNEYLNSRINFVEIDLLRSNRPMPHTDTQSKKDYRLFIRRSQQMSKGFVYAFNVRNPIPQLPIPLLPEDKELVLELGTIIRDEYEIARHDMIHDMILDYTKPPKPALSRADALWADRLLGISVENNGHR